MFFMMFDILYHREHIESQKHFESAKQKVAFKDETWLYVNQITGQ